LEAFITSIGKHEKPGVVKNRKGFGFHSSQPDRQHVAQGREHVLGQSITILFSFIYTGSSNGKPMNKAILQYHSFQIEGGCHNPELNALQPGPGIGFKLPQKTAWL
jgi:hypothetical protein